MSKTGFLIFTSAAMLLSAALTFTSCGNDEDKATSAVVDGKVDVTRKVKFKVNFTGYDADKEVQVTRAGETAGNDTIGTQYVELGNGLLAEITLQKDTTRIQDAEQQRIMTRSLDDDTYTLLAYQAGVLRGEITGTVEDGVFTPNDDSEGILLAPGTYDFVLYNSSVTREGNNLTVNRGDVPYALIGRTGEYEITDSPENQSVAVYMSNAGARLRVKFTGYYPFSTVPTATLSSYDDADILTTAVYDASTDVWSRGESGGAVSKNFTFTNSSNPQKYAYNCVSKDYMYFLPATDITKLKINVTGGNIYKKDMAGFELAFDSPAAWTNLPQGASYVANIKLMYNFYYLMSDGTTGWTKSTIAGGGDKTPVGVVVSQGQRLAISLEEVAGSKWYTYYFSMSQYNYKASNSSNQTYFWTDMDGYKYTWEKEGSLDGITVKADASSPFPAFYSAGKMGEKMTMSGTLQDKKWHLPSAGEWKYAYSLGLGSVSSMTPPIIPVYNLYSWDGNFANVAFLQLGYPALAGYNVSTYKNYWSSSEYIAVGNDASTGWTASAGFFSFNSSMFKLGWANRDGSLNVRAFIKF